MFKKKSHILYRGIQYENNYTPQRACKEIVPKYRNTQTK